MRLRAALTADPTAYREIDLVVQKAMSGVDAQALKMSTTAGSMSYDTPGAAYPGAQTITLMPALGVSPSVKPDSTLTLRTSSFRRDWP